MSAEIACLEEIKGRCYAIRVNYPDTEPRLYTAIAEISEHLHRASKRKLTMQETDALAEELIDLKSYLQYVITEAPSTAVEVEPCIKAIDWILEPVRPN